MKKLLYVGFWLILLVGVYFFRDDIVYLAEKYVLQKPEVIIKERNEYSLENDFQFVSITDDFYADSKQDILDIIYTTLDSGWEEFTFYCEKEYETCLSDVQAVINDETLLNNINNFIHPYNSFAFFESVVSEANNGTVNISVKKLYDENEIQNINAKVDEVLSSIITDDMSDISRLREIHDYIIENSTYDEDFDPSLNTNTHLSNLAYGPIIEGYGICGGYSDAFAIFLDELGIKNYKIASNNHVWNFVYVADDWYHFDLTWDDPVMSDGSEALYSNHFMIDTAKLLQLDSVEHSFDTSVYIEAK